MRERMNNKEKEYPISISNWINYLESNSHTNINLFILITTVTLAISLSVISYNVNSLAGIITLIVFGIFYIILFYYSNKASNRAKHYQKLSQRIMLGEITEPKEVLKEYKTFKKDFK